MLILYGGKRSPFVRRVEIWLTLQQRDFERRNVNIFGDEFPAFRAINPLGRVPALTIAPNEHLIETSSIIDYLEDTADGGQKLLPAAGEQRRKCMQAIAYANAVAEKGVALVYEVERRPPQFQWPDWRDRLTTQLDGGLAALEAVVPSAGFTGGDNLNGADVAAICAYDFVGTIAGFIPATKMPRLAELSIRANALPAISASYPPRPA